MESMWLCLPDALYYILDTVKTLCHVIQGHVSATCQLMVLGTLIRFQNQISSDRLHFHFLARAKMGLSWIGTVKWHENGLELKMISKRNCNVLKMDVNEWIELTRLNLFGSIWRKSSLDIFIFGTKKDFPSGKGQKRGWTIRLELDRSFWKVINNE